MKFKRAKKGSGTIIRTGKDTWALKYYETDPISGERIRRILSGLSYPEALSHQETLKRGSALSVSAPKATPEVDTNSKTISAFKEGFFSWRVMRGLKSVNDDRNRWKHLVSLETHNIDALTIEDIETWYKSKAEVLSPASIGLCLNLLSSFYKYLMSRKEVSKLILINPVSRYKALHKGDKIIKSDHNSKDTPFLEVEADSFKLFAALSEPFNIAYALSRWAGLRPGEVRALEWKDVDLTKGEIIVRQSVRQGKLGTPKSGHRREVPIGEPLVTWLIDWRKANPATTLVVPALPPKAAQATSSKVSSNPRNWSPYLNEAQINESIDNALAKANLPTTLTFYQAGRHTFASQWVLKGRSIYELSKVMGHSSVTTTERYAHLGSSIKPL